MIALRSVCTLAIQCHHSAVEAWNRVFVRDSNDGLSLAQPPFVQSRIRRAVTLAVILFLARIVLVCPAPVDPPRVLCLFVMRCCRFAIGASCWWQAQQTPPISGSFALAPDALAR